VVPGGMEVEIFCVFSAPSSSQTLAAGATVQILLFAMVGFLYFLFKLFEMLTPFIC
jgi:hypothetical protein